ncbi:MAG: tyrosine-protein kinase domain-containing protein [Anaerolineae bacterium]
METWSVGRYIRILRRHWWPAVLTLVAAVIGGYFITGQLPSAYTATATLRVATASGSTVDYAEYLYANRLTNTYVRVATSGPVREQLLERMGLETLPSISVQAVPDTELIEITVEDGDPDTARDTANTLADILVAESRKLYGGGSRPASEILSEQLAQVEQEMMQARVQYEALAVQTPVNPDSLSSASSILQMREAVYTSLLEQYERTRLTEEVRANAVSIVDPAATPTEPSSPNSKMNLALAGMAGIVGGLGLALVLERNNGVLYTTEEIEEASGLPALTEVPTARWWRRGHFFNGRSPEGEAFRRLRANLLTMNGNQPRTLLVTSAQPGDGKSITVANLAYTLAQAGKRVVVIDADMRVPALHKIFGLANQAGLSDLLRQGRTIEEVARLTAVPGVTAITSGTQREGPGELVASPQMRRLIEQLRQEYDAVLIDSPALNAVSDAAVLAPLADGVLMVVARNRSGEKAVQAARRHLVNAGAKALGVVVNRAGVDGAYRHYR